jgi:hypothetical protein
MSALIAYFTRNVYLKNITNIWCNPLKIYGVYIAHSVDVRSKAGDIPPFNLYKLMTSRGEKIRLAKKSHSVGDLNKSLQKLCLTPRKVNMRRIRFVGMRLYGEHEFSADDVVRLEKDDSGNVHPSAVKVMVLRRDKWRHVAYVNRENAVWLRTIEGFEELDLTFVCMEYRRGVYSIDLKPLQRMGVRVKAKKEVLGNRCGSWYKYFLDKDFDHPDIDYRWTRLA